MAAPERICIICYDVTDNRERARVAKVLEERMVRVQKSVFEARMTLAEAKRLFERARMEVSEEAGLRLYALPPAALAECLRDGGAPFPEAHEFWIL